MSVNSEAAIKVEHVRKSLLIKTCNLIKVRKSNDVRIVLNSFERAESIKARKSHSYPKMESFVKVSKKVASVKNNTRGMRRARDRRTGDAGFGGRILERLLIHAKESAKDSNKDQMLNAISSLRRMGFELRSTI